MRKTKKYKTTGKYNTTIRFCNYCGKHCHKRDENGKKIGPCKQSKQIRHIMDKYKVTQDKAKALYLTILLGPCEVKGCTETKDLRIEHNHSTLKVRGVVCRSCNLLLTFPDASPQRQAAIREFSERGLS